MINQTLQTQINDQINQLKKIAEKTTTPVVSMYIVMALRQLVKVLVLNEHSRFKMWRVKKAIECLCAATRLPQCTEELKSGLITIVCKLEEISCNSVSDEKCVVDGNADV